LHLSWQGRDARFEDRSRRRSR